MPDKQSVPSSPRDLRQPCVQIPRPQISAWLEAEIQCFDPKKRIQEAWLPPSSWYTAPEFFRLERDSVFRDNWLIAARQEQLTQPGQYVTGTVAAEPYVIVRDNDRKLHAFYNVCRHHAAEVATAEQGCLQKFECSYHGWTYALDGKLLNAPALGQIEGFDRKEMSLVPMHVEEWGRFVFICRSAATRSLHDDLAGLKTELDAMSWTAPAFVARRLYEVQCNWKVFVDNYLDGGYHLPWLHKGLAAQLSLDTYTTEIFERYSIQGSRGLGTLATAGQAAGEPGLDFAERVGASALYAWVYPNLMINRYGSMMDTNWVLPVGPERTRVVMDYYFEKTGTPEADELVARSLAASDVVQQEDIQISESVQRGLASSSYARGRYSTKKEMGELHFHRLLFKDFEPRDRPLR